MALKKISKIFGQSFFFINVYNFFGTDVFTSIFNSKECKKKKLVIPIIMKFNNK